MIIYLGHLDSPVNKSSGPFSVKTTALFNITNLVLPALSPKMHRQNLSLSHTRLANEHCVIVNAKLPELPVSPAAVVVENIHCYHLCSATMPHPSGTYELLFIRALVLIKFH